MDQDEATPLTQFLARGPLPPETLARWGAELAEQLTEAGPHGDIRPEAVVIKDGHAVLTGFGQPGGDPRADIYALGALLHYAGAALHPPFLDLLAWMGHADPAQRPTAAEAAARLRDLVPAEPAPEDSPPPDPPVAQAPPAGPRRRLLVVGVVAVVLLGLIGGASWYAWSRRQPPPPAGPFGDIRTADPCPLVDAKALQRFGATRLVPDRNVPSSCAVFVQPNSGNGAWLTAILSEPYLDDHDLANLPAEHNGDRTIYRHQPSADYCGRTVLLPDRSRVILRLDPDPAPSSLDLCAIADAAVPTVLHALDPPGLPRRPLSGPPNSIVWLDACGLGDEPALRAVPGLNANRRMRYEGGWACQWGDDPTVTDPPVVRFFLRGGAPLGGQTQMIAGRAASVRPNGNTDCTVFLAHRAFQGSFGEQRLEMLAVDVHLSSGSPDVCTMATTITQAAAAKLPPPS